MTIVADVDLADPGVTVRECSSCDGVVFGRFDSPEGLARLVCDYCNATDRVARAGAPAPAEPEVTAYRGEGPTARRPSPLSLDLGVPPSGLTGREPAEAIRAAWKAEKKAAVADGDEDARAAWEHRLTWLASSASGHGVRARDAVGARAVLESALGLVRTPAYRALLLARLARLAVQANGLPLARAWLAQIAPRLRAPEVTTDVRVAEAFVARADGGPAAVLELLGQGDAVDAFSGPVRFLAVALRADAHEQLGEHAAALATWTAGAKAGGQLLGSYAALYGLAPATRRRALRRGLVAIIVLVAAFWALFVYVRDLANGAPVSMGPLAVIAVALVVAILMKVSRGR
ncbi:MAG TPA: hypothetical protein PLR99_24390 [Polyangiaceae bacterium]|nr:hypothetical protein [Polyangiaceae bacterium]